MKHTHKRKIKCDYCNKIIDKAPCKTKSKHNFCDIKCYLKARKERGELTGGWKGGKIKFVCKYCGKHCSSQRSGNYEPKYCSKQCSAKDRGKKQSGSNHWNWKGGNNSRYLKKIAPRPKPEKCEICGSRGKKRNGIVLDHNHKIGEFRGWLCSNCNTIIGLAHEDTETLEIIINYLKKFNENGKNCLETLS